MIPLTERVEIVRNVRFVDAAIPALTHDKVEIWKDLRFNVLIKGNDWQGTEKGNKLERGFAALGVEVVSTFPTRFPRRAARFVAPCRTSTTWPAICLMTAFLSARPEGLRQSCERDIHCSRSASLPCGWLYPGLARA